MPAIRRVVPVAGALAVMLCSPAGASASWSPSFPIADHVQLVSSSDVGVDAAGDAVVAWIGQDDALRVAERPAGGAFGSPTVVAGSANAVAANVRVNARGDAVVSWARLGQNIRLEAIVRRAGGSFGPTEEVSPPDESAGVADLRLDARGGVTAIWRDEAEGYVVRSATRPAGGRFTEPRALSPARENAFDPHLTVNDAGDAIAVWGFVRRRQLNGLQWAARRRGGSFGRVHLLSAPRRHSARARDSAVAITGSGEALAMWRRGIPHGSVMELASRRPGAARFGAPRDLSPARRSGFAPTIVANERGDALALWGVYRSAGVAGRPHALLRPARGRFGRDITLAGRMFLPSSFSAGISPRGAAVGVWAAEEAGGRIQAVARPARARLGRAVALGTGLDPSVGVDASGGALAVWSDSSDQENELLLGADYRP